jgi:hypothetical protein
MKTLFALIVALGVAAPYATAALAQECDEGMVWDEDTESCQPAD